MEFQSIPIKNVNLIFNRITISPHCTLIKTTCPSTHLRYFYCFSYTFADVNNNSEESINLYEKYYFMKMAQYLQIFFWLTINKIASVNLSNMYIGNCFISIVKHTR